MVQEMVAQSIKEVMAEMMGTSSTPAVTPAEVVKPKSPKTLSKDDFLALAEEEEPVAVPKELDFVVFGSRTARYNGYVASDIWTINHLAITKNWGGKWSKKNGGYVFDTPANLRNFLMNYRIKSELTADDKAAIKAYKAEKAQQKAEYYAKLAKGE
jgi:hypothetical protein